MNPDITNNNNEMDPVLKTVSLHCFFCCSLPNYQSSNAIAITKKKIVRKSASF